MLEIIIPEKHIRYFNEISEEFEYIDVKETKLELEHSLVSLAKWEQKWRKAFLGEDEKTYDEIMDYIRCMTLNGPFSPDVYRHIPPDLVDEIIDYIKDPMTATTITSFSSTDKTPGIKIKKVTAEIIYYWMISLNIPIECQNWHLNTLLMLIRVINVKNGKPTKVPKKDAARERARINAERRAKYNSSG